MKFRFLILTVLMAPLLTGCWTVVVCGPEIVGPGTEVTYDVLIGVDQNSPPLEEFHPLFGFVVPDDWTLTGNSYEGVIEGGTVPVSGSGTVYAGGLSTCTDPPPPGMKKIWLTDGPFSSIEPTDTGTVSVTFQVGQTLGTTEILFLLDGSLCGIDSKLVTVEENVVFVDNFESGDDCRW